MKTKSSVAVGLSGGVDSAVAAALLCRAGFKVLGVYLHCFPHNFEKTLGCTDKEDFKMAQEVAKNLGIPFTFFDFEKDYQEKVIEYFFKEYQAGRTPNPDAVCNKEIKFGLFLERAIKELGVDFVATGHYARIISNGTLRLLASDFFGSRFARDGALNQSQASRRSQGERSKIGQAPPGQIPMRVTRRDNNPQLNYHLLRGVDFTKDQSYFLYNLSQEQLLRILFPVGEYTKIQVRQMAREFGLPNWERKDSQGICFLGKVSVRKFLKQRIKPKKGEVVDASGRVIGEHDGVWFYTIGQRHGFRVCRGTLGFNRAGAVVARQRFSRLPILSRSNPTLQSSLFVARKGSARKSGGLPAPVVTSPPVFNGPWYVITKDIENNRLIVGWGKECEKSRFAVENLNWINEPAKEGRSYQVRIRHLGELYPAHLKIESGGRIKVTLSEPAWGIAPGQVAVFYDEEEVAGGGIIENQ